VLFTDSAGLEKASCILGANNNGLQQVVAGTHTDSLLTMKFKKGITCGRVCSRVNHYEAMKLASEAKLSIPHPYVFLPHPSTSGRSLL
jgi:hypothetical protein